MTTWTPGTEHARVAVLAERRPGVTPWQDWSWRVVAVLDAAPDAPPWTVLREADGTTLFLAGTWDVALHPSDAENYKHNLDSPAPSAWVVLRATAAEPGMRLQWVTVDSGEAHLYGDVGDDVLEAVPMPPGLRARAAGFVARHYVPPVKHKRRRDSADPEALGRRDRTGEA